jgi:hypothetical protein
LVLFAAAFGGAQDAAFIRDAGLRGTCVDNDVERLGQMADEFPAGWEFVPDDVFEFAETAFLEGWQWDVVSLDPFTNLMARCAAELDTWCALARRAVILGGGREKLRPPAGWRVTERLQRSSFNGGTFWTVLER